jgi:hypothetical protein
MSRYITVSGDCEIDMCDIDLSDMIDELSVRLGASRITAKDKKEIIDFCQGVIINNRAEPGNLLDQHKNDIFEEARERFTIAELTERLKP